MDPAGLPACRQGLATFTAVPVSHEGLVDPAEVAAAVQPCTVLVTVMHSNNEVGALQPVAEVAEAVRRQWEGRQRAGGDAGLPRPLVHTDAAQSCGKVGVPECPGGAATGQCFWESHGSRSCGCAAAGVAVPHGYG